LQIEAGLHLPTIDCLGNLLRKGASLETMIIEAKTILTSHTNKGEKQYVLHDLGTASSPDWWSGRVSC